MTLKDYFENELTEGFYLYLDRIQPNICYVSINENSFKAEFTTHIFEGKTDIKSYNVYAKKLIPLGNNQVLKKNINFVKSKLEKLSQK